MVLANSPDDTETPTKFDPAFYTDEEKAGLERTQLFEKEGMGPSLNPHCARLRLSLSRI